MSNSLALSLENKITTLESSEQLLLHNFGFFTSYCICKLGINILFRVY